MNIIDRTTSPTEEFGSISEGDVFKFGDNFYMKISVIATGLGMAICNAVNLHPGKPTLFTYHEKVKRVNHELVIK